MKAYFLTVPLTVLALGCSDSSSTDSADLGPCDAYWAAAERVSAELGCNGVQTNNCEELAEEGCEAESDALYACYTPQTTVENMECDATLGVSFENPPCESERNALHTCLDPRNVTFDGIATVTAWNINPNCEEVTSAGEFSTTISVAVDNAAPTVIFGLDHETLGHGQTKEAQMNTTVDANPQSTVCVSSSGTEEHDDFVDDDMTNDADCQQITEATQQLSFNLEMGNTSVEPEPCQLKVSLTARVTKP